MAERTPPKEPANESPESTDTIEALIDEAIRSILDEAGSQVTARGRTAAPLLDAMLSGMPVRAAGRASMLERVLIAEAMANALADALAPTLAAALTPRIMHMLESGSEGQSAERQPAERERKPEGK